VFDEGGFFDNTPLIFDPILLKMAVRYATFKLAGVRMTKIMTAAVDGITLATIMAGTFDVRIVIAKPTREVGVREYLEMSYIPGTTGIIRTLFAPRKSLTAADEVIIVDDVIESAETQIVLIEMAKRARADIAAVFGLVGIGTEWKHRIREVVDCPVFVGLELGAKPKAVIRP
jgi:adenine phosphoribosyltransferase